MENLTPDLRYSATLISIYDILLEMNVVMALNLHKCLFLKKELAEVGRLPYLLALCYRYRGVKYPPGILVGFSSPLKP